MTKSQSENSERIQKSQSGREGGYYTVVTKREHHNKQIAYYDSFLKTWLLIGTNKVHYDTDMLEILNRVL